MNAIAPALAAAALVVAGALGLAACAPAENMENFVDAKAPAARVVGKPVSCLQSTRIRDTDVRSDYTIDFETAGGQWYRNTLPYRCGGLGFEERFSYSTSLAQLCSTEIITVFGSDGTSRGSCGLGEFVPIEFIDEDRR